MFGKWDITGGVTPRLRRSEPTLTKEDLRVLRVTGDMNPRLR